MTSDALGGPTSMSTEGGSMSKLKLNIAMSIDGFVAGPDQSPDHPLGVGGEQLHDWLVPLKAFREGHGEEGGEVNASAAFAEDILGGAGTTIMGPILLGGGARLFENVGDAKLEQVESVEAPGVTHIRYARA